MANYRANRRRIKKHRNYSPEDAARTLGVVKGTVLRWIKDGLTAITDQKPYLILGPDLIAFLEAREPKKQKCKLHECYCLSCRAPREPAYMEVEYHPLGPSTGNLRGLCSVCTSVMHKRINVARLDELKAVLTVTVQQDQQRLNDRTDPCLNAHMLEVVRTHA